MLIVPPSIAHVEQHTHQLYHPNRACIFPLLAFPSLPHQQSPVPSQLPCPALYLDEHLAISVAAGGFTAPLWLSAGGAPPVVAYPAFVLRPHRPRHRLWQKRELQLSATAAARASGYSKFPPGIRDFTAPTGSLGSIGQARPISVQSFWQFGIHGLPKPSFEIARC